MTETDPRRYPIGPFRPRPSLSPAERKELIEEVARLPGRLRALVAGLSEEKLDRSYREGGWSVRQVVHHLPDSHLQGYVRFKLALTEDSPPIKTYDQTAWAETPEARRGPVESSLDLLEALHRRWAFLMSSLTEDQFHRTYRHPELGEVDLDTTVQLYAWHGRHHLAHVRLVAEE